MAAENKSKECLELFLSHGAEVNIKNNVSNDHNISWWVDNNNDNYS